MPRRIKYEILIGSTTQFKFQAAHSVKNIRPFSFGTGPNLEGDNYDIEDDTRSTLTLSEKASNFMQGLFFMPQMTFTKEPDRWNDDFYQQMYLSKGLLQNMRIRAFVDEALSGEWKLPNRYVFSQPIRFPQVTVVTLDQSYRPFRR